MDIAVNHLPPGFGTAGDSNRRRIGANIGRANISPAGDSGRAATHPADGCFVGSGAVRAGDAGRAGIAGFKPDFIHCPAANIHRKRRTLPGIYFAAFR